MPLLKSADLSRLNETRERRWREGEGETQSFQACSCHPVWMESLGSRGDLCLGAWGLVEKRHVGEAERGQLLVTRRQSEAGIRVQWTKAAATTLFIFF